jgi:hypothetical protein
VKVHIKANFFFINYGHLTLNLFIIQATGVVLNTGLTVHSVFIYSRLEDRDKDHISKRRRSGTYNTISIRCLVL